MSRSGDKGREFENLCLGLVQDYYPDAHRLGKQGVLDKADIWLPASVPFVIECKWESSYAGKLSTWLGEAEREAGNASKPHYLVAHKRHGSNNPRRQYVTTDLYTIMELTRDS